MLVVSHGKRSGAVGTAPVALLTKSRLGASRRAIHASFSPLVADVFEAVGSSSKTEEVLRALVALVHERRELTDFGVGACWALPRPLSSLGAVVSRRAVVHRAVSEHVADGLLVTVPSSFAGLAIVPVFSQLGGPVSCAGTLSWLGRTGRAIVTLWTISLRVLAVDTVVSCPTVSALLFLPSTSLRSERSQRALNGLLSSFDAIVA